MPPPSASLLLHRPLSSQASSSSSSRLLASRLSSPSPSLLRRSFSSSFPKRDDDDGESEPRVKNARPVSFTSRGLPLNQPRVLAGRRIGSELAFKEVEEDGVKTRVYTPVQYDFSEPPKIAMDRASNDDLYKWARNAGAQWKWPTKGQRNWLGGDVPYPENPYFKPHPPLSCDLQAEVYEAYTRFPPVATSPFRINALSAQYGISKDRIRGIIKTGQVGESWKRLNIPSVKTFQRGMESFLCVPAHNPASITASTTNHTSPALSEFHHYLGSRIDIERDEETIKLETGERTFRTEDSAFSPMGFQQGKRLGTMSWEMANEGQQPTTFKIDMEKPLKPPPRLPMFPAKVVPSGREAVWNFVNVGDKFAGQGWDGHLHNRTGYHGSPSRKGAIRRFLPLVLANKLTLSNTRDGVVTSASILSAREKQRQAFAVREKKRAEGWVPPTAGILAKLRTDKKGEYRHEINARSLVRARERREQNLEKKARRRVYNRIVDVQSFKARVKGLSFDPK